MSHFIADGLVTSEYAGALESVWHDWEPSMRRVERMLRAGSIAFEHDPEQAADQLRRAQYRAHTSSELLSGLPAPQLAAPVHDHLVACLDACRDALGVLAVRAEIDELDEHTAEIGLQTVQATRHAFTQTRMSATNAVAMEPSLQPVALYDAPHEGRRSISFVLWSLIIACAVLFGVLLVEVLVFNAPA